MTIHYPDNFHRDYDYSATLSGDLDDLRMIARDADPALDVTFTAEGVDQATRRITVTQRSKLSPGAAAHRLGAFLENVGFGG